MAEKNKVSEENPFPCVLVHQKSHMDLPRINPRPVE
jgi:hypothetical protein